MTASATNEDISGLMQMIFGMDHKTPVKERIEYKHSFFFDFRQPAEFFQSVYNGMMTRGQGKATPRQIDAISRTVRGNFKEMVACFPNNLSAPSTLAFAGYGREEGKKVSDKYYDGCGNRKPLDEVEE